MLKNKLYNQAKAIFQTNHTINHIIGSSTHNRELDDPLSELVKDQIMDKVHNNNAATHSHTIHHIINFQKKVQKEISFGALSNNEISDCLIFFIVEFESI